MGYNRFLFELLYLVAKLKYFFDITYYIIMTTHALLFTLAAIGISETAYLFRTRRENQRPVCIIGSDCHQVLESRYSKTLGIRNDFLGIMFYILISVITAFLVIGVEPIAFLDKFARILIFAGVFMSLYFTFLQWRVIKVWCFWCLMSAMTIFLMGLILLVNNFTLLL
jgi:uncharacterized membrane protein